MKGHKTRLGVLTEQTSSQGQARGIPCSQLPGMVPLVHINAQLLQALHVGPCLAVVGQSLVAAPLGRLHRHRQLKAAEVDKVLRTPVCAPSAESSADEVNHCTCT